MNKLVLICLLLVLPAAFSASCDNPLLKALDLTALSESADVTGLAYCPKLEGENLCCPAATINTLQATTNNLVISLIKKVAARDTYLLGLQETTVSSALTTKLETLQTKTTAALNKINGGETPSGETPSGETPSGETPSGETPSGETPSGETPNRRRLDAASDLQDLKLAITPFKTIIKDMTDDYKTAKDGWSAYQQARANCMNNLVEAQASIYCLACRTDYTALGVTGTNAATAAVSLDDVFNTEVIGECYPFVTAAQIQNQRIYYNAVMTKVDELNTLMDSITTDPTQVTAAQVEAILAAGYGTDTDKQLPDASDCTANTLNNCDLITSGFFSQAGIINQDIAANGGLVAAEDAKRMLAGLRMLSTYNPADEDNSAGVTVEFPEDAVAAAAAINSAWRQGGLMTCVVALVGMLLF